MPKKIHMVGIGGIGMSALAQLYVAAGVMVSGSDREESPATRMLVDKGIKVLIGADSSNVSKDAALLVYSDAVQKDHPERVVAEAFGAEEMSYFEALGEVSRGKRVIAVSGTHGKTTTTAMIGKVLEDAGADPTVVVGSIVPQWGSNFRAGRSDLFVVEACEYKNHFLTFEPDVLVITNVEWDHTDFFANLGEVKSAFEEAARSARVVIRAEQYCKERVPDLLLPGEFNKDNARAAKTAVKALGLSIGDDSIDASLASFKGTWRRFEHKGTLPGGAELYDDYAHHPTAIMKTIQAARDKFVGKKIVIFFHPHLYSRTRDLFDDFARALASADESYILPVYAARETPDPSFNHAKLAEAANSKGGHSRALSDFIETTNILQTLDADTVAFTMGAGDIYKAGEVALKK